MNSDSKEDVKALTLAGEAIEEQKFAAVQSVPAGIAAGKEAGAEVEVEVEDHLHTGVSPPAYPFNHAEIPPLRTEYWNPYSGPTPWASMLFSGNNTGQIEAILKHRGFVKVEKGCTAIDTRE
jgi:hypothetical protein